MEKGQETAIPLQQPGIWQNKNIVLIWLSQLISLFGDEIFIIAVIWLTLDVTGDNTISGFITMAVFLPVFLFSLVAGPIVDRFERRSLMIVADAARFLLLLAFPLLYQFGMLNIYLIAILSFLVNCFSTVFLPARDVLIGELTPQNQLPSANALVQSAMPVAQILGPVVAGAFLGAFGIQHLFTVDGITFLVSLLFLAFIKRPMPIIDRQPKRSRILREVKEGLSYAIKHPVIKWLLIITVANNWFLMGPAIIGLPIFTREVMQSPAVVLGFTLESSQVYTLLLTSFSLGFLFCSLLVKRLNKIANKGRLILWAIFLDGITYGPFLWMRDPLELTILVFFHAMCVPPIIVFRTSLIQEIVPKGMQGRVFALINLSVMGVTSLSIGASGILCDLWGADVLIGLWGFLAGIVGIIGMLSKKMLNAG